MSTFTTKESPIEVEVKGIPLMLLIALASSFLSTDKHLKLILKETVVNILNSKWLFYWQKISIYDKW